MTNQGNFTQSSGELPLEWSRQNSTHLGPLTFWLAKNERAITSPHKCLKTKHCNSSQLWSLTFIWRNNGIWSTIPRTVPPFHATCARQEMWLWHQGSDSNCTSNLGAQLIISWLRQPWGLNPATVPARPRQIGTALGGAEIPGQFLSCPRSVHRDCSWADTLGWSLSHIPFKARWKPDS